MGKRVAITIHGIRTRGEWQKQLAPILARYDFIPYPIDYGRFSAPAFLLKFRRERKLDWFHREYDRICNQDRIERPSVIAHSFGTYLVAQLLERYHEVKFDKVIFAGSIVREDFDWVAAINTGRILWIRNEYATKDIWPRVAKLIIADAGNSGASGFVCGTHRYLSQEGFKIGHSGTFFDGHFKKWIQYLKQPLLSADDQRIVNNFLQIAVNLTEQKINMPKGNVRANIFVPFKDELVIPEGAHHNMDGHPDVSIRIPLGMGSTGRAFKCRSRHIAIFKNHWGDDTLPAEQLEKVHPYLKWIISIPLFDPDDGRVFGVMNIDGLCHPKTVEDLTTGPGEELLDDLSIYTDEIVANQLCHLEQGRI